MTALRLAVTTLFVDDQVRAEQVYTEAFGMEVRRRMEVGPGLYWLAVAAPGSEVLLSLEPSQSEIAEAYTRGLREASIPAAVMAVTDLDEALTDLAAAGVEVIGEIQAMGEMRFVLIDDGVGNFLQVMEQPAG